MPAPSRDAALRELHARLLTEHRLADRMSGVGFAHYLERVVIDSSPEPRRFADLAEGWQWDQARTIGPALEATTMIQRGYRGKRLFWRTMPRGHDKTSSIGRAMNWSLGYTNRYFSAIVAAADREQAALLTDFMEAEARLNPWLYKRLRFKQNRVEGRHGANLRVLAADASGSYGQKPDVMIFDELTHWGDNSGLWEALVSGREKRPNSVMFVITNAGVIGSWQWEAREVARTSKHWHFYEAPGPLASWMSPERTADMRRMLPRNVCRRVLDNEWLDPGEDCGFVTRGEAQACEDMGRAAGLIEQTEGRHDLEYVAGVDYGPKRDRTVLVVGHRAGESFVVDQMVVLEGKNFPEGYVPVTVVEAWIDKTRKAFPRCVFVIDPYQMDGTIQMFQGVANIERFEPRAGKANYELAQGLRSAVVNGRVTWYPGCGEIVELNDARALRPHTLVDEFSELIIQTTAAGYRLNHLPGKHDDRVVALGMAVWRALGGPRRRQFVFNDRYF